MNPASPATPEPQPETAKKIPVKVTTGAEEDVLPPDADFEDRFLEYWKKNGASIFGGIAAAALILVGIQSYRYFQQRHENTISQKFGQAQDIPAWETFIRENGRHRLSALAQVRIGNQYFQEGKFQEAVAAYDQALPKLENSLFAQRARLAKGVAQLRCGQSEAGIATLLQLADDPQAYDTNRGEAAYTAAVALTEKGDFAAAEEALRKIDFLKQKDNWSFRAQTLRDRVPQLQKPAAEVAQTVP